MSTYTSNRKGGSFAATTFRSIAYLLLFGIAVVLFIAIDPAILAEAGAMSVALWVSLGAALSGVTVSFFATGHAPQMPKASELPRFLLTSGIVAISSIAFWTVSLEASMLLAAIAQPLRVVAEASFAGLFMAGKESKRRWDRMAFDTVLGFILMGLVIGSDQVGDVTAGMAFVMVAALVVIGMLSELFLMALQLKESDENVHPASKVATINTLLAFAFFVSLLMSDAANIVVGDSKTTMLLIAIGAIGTAGPTIMKLLLLRSGHAANDVSILALGFSGAVSFVTLASIAAIWLLSYVVPLPNAMAVLTDQLGSGSLVWMSLLISIFVLTRFWAGPVSNTPNDPDGDSSTGEKNPKAEDKEDVSASILDGDWMERTHPAGVKAYMDARDELRLAVDAGALDIALSEFGAARASLGHSGFALLPSRLLIATQIHAKRNPAHTIELRDALITFDAARKVAQRTQLHTGNGRAAAHDMEIAYRTLLLILYRGSLTLPVRLVLWASRRIVLSTLTALVVAFAAVTNQLATVARRMPGKTGLEIWAGGFATVLERFASVEALMTSGLETSVGFRFVIPGTGGLIANAGLWVMIYTGSLKGFLTRSNPMLLNPGLTLATPIWIATWNRPGLGMGPSLPFGNAYLDAQRYKLLLGVDGVGYIRVGHWEGRGAYGTVSGSFPLIPGLRGTWNASLFSPGLEPIVRSSTPLARWMRTKSTTVNERLFRLVKR